MAKKTVNVAVIGVGNMGTHHARIYSELPWANLIAVSDSRQKVSREIAKKFKCKSYKDHKKMLINENFEAVSIAVPSKFHKKVAIDSIRAGKHVLVEKPIAPTMSQSKEIIEAAKKRGVILTIGHVERFNPVVQKLKKIINQGKLGQIVSIVAKRVGPFAPQAKDIGVLIDVAIHDIDIINYLLDRRPKKIYANGGKAIGSYREDHADILLDYDSVSGYIQVNWITPIKMRKLHITGTKGYAELDYIAQKLDLYKSQHRRKRDKYGKFMIEFAPAKKINIPIKFEEPLKLELKSFLTNIMEDTNPEVTGEDGLRALKVVLKVLKNIKHV